MSRREYIQLNRRWLAEKAREEGVLALPKGIHYRILASGDPAGLSPTPRSIVVVHYTGRTIDGNIFDSSIGGTAPAFRLSELIEGWIIALQQMRPGDKWELYLPAEVAYGKYAQPGIPGSSTLIFEIELVSVA